MSDPEVMNGKTDGQEPQTTHKDVVNINVQSKDKTLGARTRNVTVRRAYEGPRKSRTPKPRSLTAKQKKLVEVVVREPRSTLADIGIKSAYVASPAQSAWRELQKPHVQEAVAAKRESLREVLLRRGLDENKIADCLTRGLTEATADGRLGEHVDRLAGYLGYVEKPGSKDGPSMALFLNFGSRLEAEGVVDIDGKVSRLESDK